MIAFSDMLPVSRAGTDGVGEPQVMAQKKTAQGKGIISIRKLGKNWNGWRLGREN